MKDLTHRVDTRTVPKAYSKPGRLQKWRRFLFARETAQSAHLDRHPYNVKLFTMLSNTQFSVPSFPFPDRFLENDIPSGLISSHAIHITDWELATGNW